MLDTLLEKKQQKKSTAHTLGKHGLEHNCITIALKNTTNHRIAFSCRFENKLIWTKDLESTSLPKYCLLFHISTCNIFIPGKKKCPDLTDVCFERRRKRKWTKQKLTHKTFTSHFSWLWYTEKKFSSLFGSYSSWG